MNATLATDRQRRYLLDMGVTPKPRLTKESASALIGKRIHELGYKPASPGQKDKLQFFGARIPAGLTYDQASESLDAIMSVEANADAWLAHEDRSEELQFLWEMVRDEAELFGCKKPSRDLFEQTVAALQTRGSSVEAMTNDSAAFFRSAMKIDPSIKIKLKRSSGRRTKRRAPKTNILHVLIGLIVLAAFVASL
jgi:hypothetical protein